jgi:hypothetical protein
MATKADFTDSEWEALEKGITGAGTLVAISDRGFFDTFKEASALAKHIAAAKENTQSAVVRQLADGHGVGFGITTPPAEIEAGTVEALHSAVQVLQAKAPDEVEAYRAFVLDVARSVAAAAPGGDEAEAGTIAKLEEALASPSA